MNAATWTRLAGVNQFATLRLVRRRSPRRHHPLHASVSLTAENWLLARSIALHAMALQMADAFAKRSSLPTPSAARLPPLRIRMRGLREQPDEMVGILEVYQQRGDGDSPFNEDEIAELVHLDPRPWTMAANEPHRCCRSGIRDGPAGAPRTGRRRKAPSLGSGLQMRLPAGGAG
jgi:hypothetical protein